MITMSNVRTAVPKKTERKVKKQGKIGIFKGSRKGDPKAKRGQPKLKVGSYLVLK